MSKRFMELLEDYVAPGDQEVYSIDECFLKLTAYEHLFDLTEYAQDMRAKAWRWLDYPAALESVALKLKPRLPIISPRRISSSMGV